MYSVGDSVVYPTHGAGIIVDIEKKEVLGKVQSYYVLKMPIGGMRVMVPMDNANDIGIRDVIDKSVAEDVIENFRSAQINVIQNWSKRFRENMVKIKSGNIYEVSGVVKSLMMRDKQRGLSTGERKMLNNAKQIMISELVVATGSDRDSIENVLSDMIDEELANGTN